MRRGIYRYLVKLRRLFPYAFGKYTTTITFAILIGAVTGCTNIVFRYILDLVKRVIFIRGQEILQIGYHNDSRIFLPILPILGAVLLIPLSKIFKGGVYGYRFPDFLEKVNLKGGIISFKSVLIRMIAPALTIGSGGSAGVEGPIAQIGGGIGSLISQFLGTSAKQRTLMIAAGSAGAISATFNAPITGVMFATEIILLGNYGMMSFGAVIISAGIAAAISNGYYGVNPTFIVPVSKTKSLFEMPLYLMLGLYMGVISVIYIKFFYWVKGFFEKLEINEHLKPIIGAFTIGLIGIIYPHVMSDGYEYIVQALKGNYLFYLMLILVFVKIIATSVTLGSGGAGGVFAPSLFIGAMAGGAFGSAVNHIFPLSITSQFISPPGTYAAIGMGVFLASVTHAPMTGMFLMFELTGNYQIMIPVMLSSATGVFMATRILKDSIDTMALTNRGIKLNEGLEETILSSIKVTDVMTTSFETIDRDVSINEAHDLMIMSKGLYFPVVNSEKELIGIISMNDIKSVVFDNKKKHVITAGDFCTKAAEVFTSEDNLNIALSRLSFIDLDEMPVVDVNNQKKVIGMISRSGIYSTYYKKISHLHDDTR
ncbi:MAG: chloride channel protein [Nitrospirae bacterium]|nr:chloride channel protein [Nitrospirota bacterium]MBF0539941.1 chloride channel protein [Nitrospirota bacterium]